MAPSRLPAIEVKDLSKRYTLRGEAPARLRRALKGRAASEDAGGVLWALEGVSFTVQPGERVAVFGSNGAGKSTLLKILSRVVAPTRGEARLRGRLASLLEVGVGFHDSLSGLDNVYLSASLHGARRQEIDGKLESIVDFSGLDRRFLGVRVKHYSSGMRLRLAFSVAAHLDPDILLLDEVLAVGDLGFQQRCLARVGSMISAGKTVLLVSHSPAAALRFCDRALWLEGGKLVMDGPAPQVAERFQRHFVSRETALSWESSAPSPSAQGEVRSARVVPGPPAAELLSVRLVAADGGRAKAPVVHEGFAVEVSFRVIAEGVAVLPSLRFSNDSGSPLFLAVYTPRDRLLAAPGPGLYRSRVWVPPHLLQPGLLRVAASLSTPASLSPSGLLLRHAELEDALTFEVEEAPPGQATARGPYREVGGAVRPLFRWETQVVSDGTGSEPGAPRGSDSLSGS